MAKGTDVFAEVYGVKTKVGTATTSQDGARVVSIDENYNDAELKNLTFGDVEEGAEVDSVVPTDAATQEQKLEVAGTASTEETATTADAPDKGAKK